MFSVMSFTFIHTADWQIGKPFGEFSGDKPGILRQERLNAIDRTAAIARAKGARHVLVAGDVFDFETGSAQLVRQLMQRLAGHGDLSWHLISGNHDPAKPGSVWDSARDAAGGIANVVLHLEHGVHELEPGVSLLSAPLHAKACHADPTDWMDQAVTPEGNIRIGMAHGSVTGFGSEGDAAVPIDPRRPALAGLAYLALGDWHGTKMISDRVWYSGTPEPDSFASKNPGNVLAVTLRDAAAPPQVESMPSAHFTWTRQELRLTSAVNVQELIDEVMPEGPAASSRLLQLVLRGSLSLDQHGELSSALSRLEASLFHLDATTRELSIATGAGSLDAFTHPALRAIAENLNAQANATSDAGPSRDAEIARLALLRLAEIARAHERDEAA